MKKLVFVLAFLLLFCGCGFPGTDGPWAEFGNIRPIIMVNGKNYFLDQGFSSGFIPEDYKEIGEVSSVTKEYPTKELQIRSGVPISGKVFSGENTATVYIMLSEPEFMKGYSMQLICQDLITNPDYPGHRILIYLDGKFYQFDEKSKDKSENIPYGFEKAGTLKTIGADRIPQNDFEINIGHGSSVSGRNVYVNPADSSAIYVYQTLYEGTGPSAVYIKCPVFEE